MRRGHIWRVSMDPSIGDEIRKTRPAVVVSADGLGILRLRVVVPLTAWQPGFAAWPWMVRIDPSPENGLTKPSAADALQVKSLSVDRFIDGIGALSDDEMARILHAIDRVLGKA